MAQSSKWLHFGLGQNTAINKLTVSWPGGRSEEFTNLEPNHRYLLVQGAGRAGKNPPVDRTPPLVPRVPKLPPDRGDTRIPLVTLLPLWRIDYRDFDDQTQQLGGATGKTVLLNLWASWCRPCLVELKEFAERKSEITESGIEIVALSVDGVGDDKTSPADAARTARQLGFPFPTGKATPRTLEVLQHLHDSLIALDERLPLPTSFLIDGDGRLAVIYKGSVSVDQLLHDARLEQATSVDRYRRAMRLAGRILDEKVLARRLKADEHDVPLRLADALRSSGLRDEARHAYAVALKANLDSADAHNNFGGLLAEQGDLRAAKAEFEHAIRLKPGLAAAHRNLGNLLLQQGDLRGAKIEL